MPEPHFPSPDTLGWTLEDDKWVHIMTSLPPAPEAIIQAPVVRKVDSAIHWINYYPLDSAIGCRNTYPLDSNLSGG